MALDGERISSFRARLIFRKSSDKSIPRYRLSKRLAATPVVLLPAKGSSTHAPGLVEARIALASTESGFWVGCLPQDFSQGAIAGNDFPESSKPGTEIAHIYNWLKFEITNSETAPRPFGLELIIRVADTRLMENLL